MRTWRILLVSVLISAPSAWAHGGGHRNDPPPPSPPPPLPPTRPPLTPVPTPPPGIPPGYRRPSDGPPQPPPPSPTPGQPRGPATPRAPGSRPPRPDEGRKNPTPRTRPRPSVVHSTWRLWWDYNREYMLGLRGLMRRAVVVTKTTAGSSVDAIRATARGALREIASGTTVDPKVRAAAYIALGRVATEKDALVFLRPFGAKRQDDAVLAAAALGAGMLPPIKSARVRQYMRTTLEHVFSDPARSRRVRGFATMAAGMRGRHDKVMALTIARYCATVDNAYDAAVYSYSCGLSRDPVLLPELLQAARKSKLGAQKLSDHGRAHACGALGLIDSPLGLDTLLDVMGSRRTGRETKRAAILAVGRHLRERDLDENVAKRVRRELLTVLRKAREPMARAFAALGLGGAKV
ncbi:MAG: hypothetical protein OER88_12015, partial [Planctomycetota bacterium]|nr:hypothetical protein [Planctomycetota bacterium]